MIDYTSVSQIKEVLEIFHLAMQKKFGQNFLVHAAARQAIVKELRLETVETAWEIGPGLGSITSLVPLEKKLTLFEIDYGFIRFLEAEFPERETAPGDFLKTFPAYAEANGVPDLIYGNLPYCSAAAMIGSLIEKRVTPPRMVFTVQKEVAQRMKALPGSKDYSSFSLVCALDYRVKLVSTLGADCFFPRPDVVSAVVTMEKHEERTGVDRLLYLTLVRDFFRSRRKTIRNNYAQSPLRSRFSPEAFAEAVEGAGARMSDRGESLTAAAFAEIASRLSAREER